MHKEKSKLMLSRGLQKTEPEEDRNNKIQEQENIIYGIQKSNFLCTDVKRKLPL